MGPAVGEQNVFVVDPVMGAEDFSHYGRVEPKIPSLIFWLGAVKPSEAEKAKKNGKSLPSLHSPFFAPDAKLALETGVKAMSATALGIFNQKTSE